MIYSVKLQMETSAACQKVTPACGADVDGAVRILRAGGVVGVPTDTLYGLAADATNAKAISRVFRIKGRRPTQGLPILLADISDMDKYTLGLPEIARNLVHSFFPGPLTLVLHSTELIPEITRGGMSTVAVRIPDQWVPREIVRRLGAPITGTSANKSGSPDPTTAEQVRQQLGQELDLIVDTGDSKGVESSIVDVTVTPPILLREGALKLKEIEDACGVRVAMSKPKFQGSMTV